MASFKVGDRVRSLKPVHEPSRRRDGCVAGKVARADPDRGLYYITVTHHPYRSDWVSPGDLLLLGSRWLEHID